MSGAKTRVLVVDDDLATLATYRTILQLAGYEAVGASNGGEALAAIDAQRRSFDIVLVDLRLSDMSGLEVLASARESSPEMAIIVVSGWAAGPSVRAAKQLGATDFLHKPVFDVALIEAVERNLPHSPRQPGTEPLFVDYAASRWATLVVPITRVNSDVPTLADWSKIVFRSRSTIKTWCHAAGVQAADSLDFARALRVILQHQASRCNWFHHLAIVDPRTLAKFLKRGGLQNDDSVPTLAVYLQHQQFITDPDLTAAVDAVLKSSRSS